MKKAIIALDVGGTYIKGMVFSQKGEELLNQIKMYPSQSHKNKQQIIQNFVYIISDLYKQILDAPVQLMSLKLAFPGPFDYKNGISHIKDLNKYNALYGVNLKQSLLEDLRKMDLPLNKEFSIYFQNDATCFAIGEYMSHHKHTKAGYIVLGTGVGSSFISKGKLIRGNGLLPESGMIYNERYLHGKVDDYLSARGLSRIVQLVYKEAIGLEELYGRAKAFDAKAIEVFKQYGLLIADVMTPYIQSLQLEELVFGGQISKSFEFFGKELNKQWIQKDIQIVVRVSEDTSMSTMRGLFYVEEAFVLEEKYL